MKHTYQLFALLLSLCLLLSACTPGTPATGSLPSTEDKAPATAVQTENEPSQEENSQAFSPDSLPAYTSEPWVAVNGNVPYFTQDEIKNESFEYYSNLDALGRCGVTLACIGKDIMPTEDRGNIGQVKPSGWQTVKYDFVDGKYLYNRCHLIGFQLTGENANTRNLITGTRYLNVEGMLPFENMVADFVKETGYHVMYRVTPVFVGNDLVAKGVLMEALSVEDGGEGIEFCIYCFNVQPGVVLDYATGSSSAASTPPAVTTTKAPTTTTKPQAVTTYILNTNTKKIHLPSCSYANKIAANNRKESTSTLSALEGQGYTTCGHCF